MGSRAYKTWGGGQVGKMSVLGVRWAGAKNGGSWWGRGRRDGTVETCPEVGKEDWGLEGLWAGDSAGAEGPWGRGGPGPGGRGRGEGAGPGRRRGRWSAGAGPGERGRRPLRPSSFGPGATPGRHPDAGSAGQGDGGGRSLRPGPVRLRLHLGPLRRAPVAAPGAALPPACAAPGGREGERPAVCVPVVGGRVVGWAVTSLPAPQNPTPHLFVRSDPPPSAQRPHGCIPPPIPPLIAYPIPSSTAPAHPPISSTLPWTLGSSASTPAAIAVPSHSSSLFYPSPSLHPSPWPPAPNLPSFAFLLPSIPTLLPHSLIFPQSVLLLLGRSVT